MPTVEISCLADSAPCAVNNGMPETSNSPPAALTCSVALLTRLDRVSSLSSCNLSSCKSVNSNAQNLMLIGQHDDALLQIQLDRILRVEITAEYQRRIAFKIGRLHLPDGAVEYFQILPD